MANDKWGDQQSDPINDVLRAKAQLCVFAGGDLFVDGKPIGKCGPIVVHGKEVPRGILDAFPTAVGASAIGDRLRIVHRQGPDLFDDTYCVRGEGDGARLSLEKRVIW
jgi:hypothetical protein